MMNSFEGKEVRQEKFKYYMKESDSKSEPEPEPSFPPGYFRRSRIRTPKKIAAIVILISLITVFVMFIKYSVDEVKIRSIYSRFSHKDTINPNNEPTGDVEEIKVEVIVLSVDLIHSKVQAHISFFPSKKFEIGRGRIKDPIHAYFGYYQKTFPVNSTMTPVEVTFPILTGSTSYYPFDVFQTEIAVELTNVDTNELMPVEVSLQAGIPSLQFQIDKTSHFDDGSQKTTSTIGTSFDDNINSSKYRFKIIISRPNSVIFFSMFIVILMWVMSSAIVGVALSIVFLSPYRPGSTYMDIGSALLFALPNLRETQPGVPPIGIIIDSIGFFWYSLFCLFQMLIFFQEHDFGSAEFGSYYIYLDKTQTV